METSCYFHPLPQFSFKGSLLLIRFICNELSELDYTSLYSYLNEDLILILLIKMEMHFFLLVSLDSVVKVTAGISKRILLGINQLHDGWYLISDHVLWQEGSSSCQPEMWIWVRQIQSFAKPGQGQRWVQHSVPALCAVTPAQALPGFFLACGVVGAAMLLWLSLSETVFLSLAWPWGEGYFKNSLYSGDSAHPF